MPIRLDGRCIRVVVLTSYCIFCVYVGLLFLVESERRPVCDTVPNCFLNLLTVVRLNIVAPVPWQFLGHQQTCKGRERAGARAWGEWEKRGEQNWGVPLKPPLQIRGAERGSKWLVLCGWCETLKSQSHLQHSLHQVH